MTKDVFCKVYDAFAAFIKQDVNGEYCWNASCEFDLERGDFELVLHPDCLIWSGEFAFLHTLCERMVVSCAYYPWKNAIRIW